MSFLKKIFLILFLDLFAYSTIMPLLPILFLNSEYFLSHYSNSYKVVLLGALYAIYPLFQTITSPLWLKLADRLGRKTMLKISFVGNCLGYLLSSFAILHNHCVFLFLGNAIAGCMGVNLSTIHALISDFTEGKRRIRYFGLVNLILGLSFALGPFLSSFLVPKIPHVETVAFIAFILASIVAFGNFIFISTLKQPVREDLLPIKPVDLNRSLFQRQTIFPLFMMFLTTFGWYIFIKTFQLFLLQSGKYGMSEVLKLVAFYGFSTVLAQSLFVTGIYKKFTAKISLYISLFGLSTSIALFVIQPHLISLHIHIFAIACFQSMVTPNLLSEFSKNHSPEIHGQMMSAQLGIVSLAKILAPTLSGLLVAFNAGLSLMTSAGIMFVAACCIPLLFSAKAKEEMVSS